MSYGDTRDLDRLLAAFSIRDRATTTRCLHHPAPATEL
jgi:hypothetical protein